jgi:Cu/Ag efflux pump CusA
MRGKGSGVMRGLIALSLKFRALVVGAAVVMMALGAFQLPHAAVDALPEFTPPQVQVQTEAPGLSSAEVEQLITVPLEQDLLNGVAWLARLRSESAPGLSTVDLIFQPGTDVLKARQAVQERLTQARALPNVGTPPVMVQPLSSASRAMMIGLDSKDLSLIDLSVLARWKIKPRLMAIPGVANVLLWGQADRQLQVEIDPDKLRSHGVSLDQVVSTTGNALWVSPLNFLEASTPGTGGFIDTPNQRFAIQHVLPITTPKDLGSVTIENTGGQTLRLSDVSTVVQDHQPLIGDAVLSGGPGLILVVEKFPGANTRDVTAAVESALDTLRPGLSGVAIDTSVYRPASYLDSALRNVGFWAMAALVLFFALLIGFFYSWRAALVGLVALAVAETGALYVLYLTGATFNLLVLAGLAVALGAVVGDAVAGVHALRQRLREHAGFRSGQAKSAVVVETAAAVCGPAFYVLLIILLAAVPVYLVDGWAGAFARPLVLSYALAVALSTLVAVVLTPALAVMLLSDRSRVRRESRLPVLARCGFDRVAPLFLDRRRYVAAALVLLVGAGLAVLPQLSGRTLIPATQDRDLLVHVRTAPGTSLAETTRITSAVGRDLRALPGIRDVGAHAGRAVTSDQSVNVNSGELWVALDGSADYDATVAAVDRTVHGYPGLGADVLTYSRERVDAVRAQADNTNPVVVRVYGQDLPTLQAQARRVRDAVSTVPGVDRPRVQSLDEEPTLQVEVNLAAAQHYGVKPGDVRRTATTYFSGLLVGSFYEDQKVFDVVVWGTPSVRSDPANLAQLLIATPSGGYARLGDIASVKVTPFPTAITHDATSRSLDVSAGVGGRDLPSVLADVKARVQGLRMPVEYHAEVFSDVARQQSQDLRTGGIALAALVGILLLLQAAFGSWRAAGLVLVLLPLAATGGVLSAFAVGGVWSLGGLLGLAAVCVIATRSVVPLVHRYQHAELPDGAPRDRAFVLDATRASVEPVTLTALGTALMLAPLLVFGPTAGLEVLYPFAVVVLGGLVTSTLVTLLVVPALYLRFASGGVHGGAVRERVAVSTG